MKSILNKLFIAAFVVLLVSCAGENQDENSDFLTKIVDIEFKTNNKAKNSESSTIDGQIEFTMNDDDENFLDFTFSDNILNQISVSEVEFYEMLKTEMQYDDSARLKYQGKSNGKDSDIAKCKAACYKEFTDDDGKKIRGRGWCIAGCYVDEVIRVAVILVPILAK